MSDRTVLNGSREGLEICVRAKMPSQTVTYLTVAAECFEEVSVFEILTGLPQLLLKTRLRRAYLRVGQ